MSNLRLDAQPFDAEAMVACVFAAGEAQLRMHYVPPEPYVRRTVSKPAQMVTLSLTAADFTPNERAVYRALALKFPPEKCVEMVLRSRKAGGQ